MNCVLVSNGYDMKTGRSYTMGARADAVKETRQQILRVGMALWHERLTLSIGLAEIAERAGVTVRTLLRHFGSREGLFDELMRLARDEVAAERETPIGDVGLAVTTLLDHYEARGDVVMRMLEEARVNEQIAGLVETGRRFHRRWVRAVFAPQLAARPNARAIEDLLVVATDVYTWQLLRRDAGLSRRGTEQRIRMMVDALLAEEA